MDKSPTPRRNLLKRVFLSPDERRLRAGWRVLGQIILLLLFALIFGAIFVGVSFVLPPEVSLDQSSMLGMLGGQVITLLAVTLSVYLARRLFDRRSFVSLGLRRNTWALRDLLFGIGIAGLIMGLVYIAEWALGWLTFEGFAWEFDNTPQVIINVLIMFFFFVIVGWEEELLSRGYWLQNLSAGLNLFWGVLLSSLFFAVAHVGNPNVSFMAILGLVAGGIFLAYGYIRTHQLWLPIGLHIGWNFFEGTVFGFQVSGLNGMPHLVIQTVEGPEIITGGAFGPEAGLIIFPVLLLGVVVIKWYTSDRNSRVETIDLQIS